jgi:PST family polysaccharide transporter
LIVLGGTIVLFRVLDPEDLGTFAMLQFALTFFQVFGETGVGSALIQENEEPSQRALSNVFTLQAFLAILVVGLVWVLAPGVRRLWPGLPPGAAGLLRAMAISFLFVAARVVPSILLERRLRFGAIALADVVQTAAFYLTACLCAIGGLGDWTWPAAVVMQSVAGTVVVYVAQPWRPKFALEWSVLRPLIRFGLPFQVKNLVGFVNGALTPVFAGAALGPAAVGLLSWAQQLAHLPLRLVEVIARVSFPLYSRLQYDRRALAGVIERSFQLGAFGVFFTTALFVTLGPNITTLVFSGKWLPGLVALYAFSAVLILGFVSPIAGAAFDALGRPEIIARLALFWTILNWIVVPLTTWRWGLAGFVLGSCVHVVAGNLAVLVVLRQVIPEMRLLKAIAAPAIGGLLVAGLGWFVLRPWATTLPRLGLGIGGALALHAAAFSLADRQAVRIVRELLKR